MTQTPLDKLTDLTNKYPSIEGHKTNRAMGTLKVMVKFYEERIDNRDGKVRTIFKGYVITLMYAFMIIKLHRELTAELAKLAEEANDETRTNS